MTRPDSGRDAPALALAAAERPAVAALLRALELHDYRRGPFGETIEHCGRVAALAAGLAERAAPELLDDPSLLAGFLLHDIGMIGVSTELLTKAGPLSSSELGELREHPLLGERVVAPLRQLGGLARQVIASHHERWDGTGYPRGLQREQIPLAARLFAVADAFDSMTRTQLHRDSLPAAAALLELERQAGKDFDPRLVPVFVELAVGEAATALGRAAG